MVLCSKTAVIDFNSVNHNIKTTFFCRVNIVMQLNKFITHSGAILWKFIVSNRISLLSIFSFRHSLLLNELGIGLCQLMHLPINLLGINLIQLI